MVAKIVIKMTPLNITSPPKYKVVVGTGGIGAGRVFLLDGNHTLGREESRGGHFRDARDYCKQHIILHYIKVLLGDSIDVYPVGCVGRDDSGDQLFREMEATGMVMDFVDRLDGRPTLFSFCFHYPDGAGGNMTTNDSACAAVDAAYVRKAESVIATHGPAAIVMAAPEVPLDARHELLTLGRKHGAFSAASFTSGEIVAAAASGTLALPDLIAINIDEARTIAEQLPGAVSSGHVVEDAIARLRALNPDVQVAITAGRSGSWCSIGERLYHRAVPGITPVSTAGAGDAFFAGLLAGLVAGCTLNEAQQLATVVAGVSVRSAHTIHPGLDRDAVRGLVQQTKFTIGGSVAELLRETGI